VSRAARRPAVSELRGIAQSVTIEDAMSQAIDDGLMVLGETVRRTIYQCLERKHQLKREEIPEKLPTFHEALERMTGAGAKVIERQIARNLYSRLGLNFTGRMDWTIVEYFDHAKKAREEVEAWRRMRFFSSLER